MTGNMWSPSGNWGDPAMAWLQQLAANQGQGPSGQGPAQAQPPVPSAHPMQSGAIASQSPFAQGGPLAFLMPSIKTGGNQPIAGMMPAMGPHGMFHNSGPQSPGLDAGGNPLSAGGGAPQFPQPRQSAPMGLPPHMTSGTPLVQSPPNPFTPEGGGGQGPAQGGLNMQQMLAALPQDRQAAIRSMPPHQQPVAVWQEYAQLNKPGQFSGDITPEWRDRLTGAYGPGGKPTAMPGAPGGVADPHNTDPEAPPGAPGQVADRRDPQRDIDKQNMTYGGGSPSSVADQHDEESTQPPDNQMASAGGNDADAQAPGKGVGANWLSQLAKGMNNPLTQFGFGMMAAGGKRGSTFLGAAGEGGMYATEQQRKQQQQENEQSYRQGMLGLEGQKLQQTGKYQQGELGIRADGIRAQLMMHGSSNQNAMQIAQLVDKRDRDLSADRIRGAQAQHEDDAANKMVDQWQQSYNNTMRTPSPQETKQFQDRVSMMFPRSSAVVGWRANDVAQMIQGINADKTLTPQQRQERSKFLMDQLNQQLRQ